MVRTHQTAANIPAAKTSFKELDEIHAGTFDGMTYDEVAEMHPEEYKARGSDKLNYRYPKGKFRKNSILCSTMYSNNDCDCIYLHIS